MRHATRRCVRRQVESLRSQFAQVDGLPFANVLSDDLINAVLTEEKVSFRDRIYSPLITLAMMLSQSQDDDPSLRQAVARLNAQRATLGLPAIDSDTGAFSKARGRLPEKVIAQLARRTGQGLLRDTPKRWQWHDRNVKIIDGSTLSMPDTAANQNAYPQARTQKPGLGFPIMRFVVLLSLAVGTVLNAAYGPYRGKGTGETALLRQLYDDFDRRDVLLADAYFCTYFIIAELQRRGVDIVVPLHQCRRADFRRGRRLGTSDQVVIWSKPARPEWMTEADYDQYPATIGVRQLRVRIPHKRSRRRTFVVVTTLLNDRAYPKADIAELYRQRWHVELDLRSLKDVLHLDVLRGRTPTMVHKEFWAHLLAYNLIRTTMAQAAQEHGCDPRTLSFKGALQTLRVFALSLLQCPAEDLPGLVRRIWSAIAEHRVGDRPGRVEPRARKRRPKPHKNLTQPRAVARKLELRDGYG